MPTIFNDDVDTLGALLTKKVKVYTTDNGMLKAQLGPYETTVKVTALPGEDPKDVDVIYSNAAMLAVDMAKAFIGEVEKLCEIENLSHLVKEAKQNEST
jgi:hypothetical protein